LSGGKKVKKSHRRQKIAGRVGEKRGTYPERGATYFRNPVKFLTGKAPGILVDDEFLAVAAWG